MDLNHLRDKLTTLDSEIIALIAKRQDIVQEIGRSKRAKKQGTRDYAREKVVLDSAAEAARQVGVTPKLAKEIMTLLIESSLSVQEQQSVAAEGRGEGKTALVIGGAGKMGGWFCRFLRSQGYQVDVGDPGSPDDMDWQNSDLPHDLIVVATPLGTTPEVLMELARRKPNGLIFDLGSLKSPLDAGFQALKSAGCFATSIHPMFGPDTELLSKRHVVFVDLGVAEATTEAKALFGSTMVEPVDMTLQDHDRLIAFILGLSHALNISFFTALAQSGENVPRLAQLSSTTFDAQLSVAHAVSQESPHLYYEIQALNPHGGEARTALFNAVSRLNEVISDSDESGFVDLMQSGQHYFLQRAKVESA
ncbi:MAG: chorismate mutase [Pseudomonadota bacterium]